MTTIAALLTCAVVLVPTAVAAQTTQTTDIDKDLHNPLSSLREVFVQLDALPDVDGTGETALEGSVQTVWPFDLGGDWKVVTYSIIPVLSEPGPIPGAGRSTGIGDATFFGYFVPPSEGVVLWGVGPALVAPTHTDDSLGNEEWAAGPALIVGAQPGNWSLFGLFDNVWSFAGSGERINQFNFQYLAVYLLPKSWYFISNWIVEADWEAARDDRWTVPVGAGFGRSFQLGPQQAQAYGQIGYNVARPVEAASWRAIATIDFVF